MNFSRLLCLVVVLSVLLRLSSRLVEAACCTHQPSEESAPVAPLNEESDDAFESDLEFDDIPLFGGTNSETTGFECLGEVLSERRLLLAGQVCKGDLAPRAPPVD